MKTLNKLTPFGRFCCTIGNLPTSYMESLTYEQQLLWLCKYLEETVIPAVNNNAEAVEELQSLYIQLKAYVDNYFDNLDIQEEVNHKLDEMVESGQLITIISQYFNVQKVYDTILDMIDDSATLSNNLSVKTLGYYDKNDGGGASYVITDTGIADNIFVYALDNGKFAKLLIEDNNINIKQLGARPQNNTTKYDIKPYIVAYLDYIKSLTPKARIKLYIPSGIWALSPLNIDYYHGFYIYGDENLFTSYPNGTVITSMNPTQTHLLALSGVTHYTSNFVLKNITFSSANFKLLEAGVYEFDSYNEITNSALILKNTTFGITDNLYFNHIKGTALKIASSWEVYFKLLNFRWIEAPTSGVVVFDTIDTTLTDSANISANNFEKIMFESTHGDCMVFEENCKFLNNHIGVVNFEDKEFIVDNEVYTRIEEGTVLPEDINYFSLFNVKGQLKCVIDSIELNNINYRYYTKDNENYLYHIIVKGSQDNFELASIINSINVAGMWVDTPILYQHGVHAHTQGYLSVGKVNNNSLYNFIFDVNGYKYIDCNSNIRGYNTKNTYEISNYSTMIPFYKAVKRASNANYGALYYDKSCYNDLMLAVKLYNGASSSSETLLTTSAALLCTGNNITLRAKVPNGETVNLAFQVYGKSTVSAPLVGTGNYEMYTIQLPNFAIGDRIAIRGGNNVQGKDVYLDSFIMY